MKRISNTKEIQEISLGILEYIRDLCEKNDIKFYLDSGTALGAVRHSGFIPWDDDVDILMLRNDYNKFVKVVQEDDNALYKLISLETDKKYGLPLAKVIDTRTILKQVRQTGKTNLGIYVDVFISDNIPDDEIKLKKLLNKQRLLQRMWEIFQYKVTRVTGIRSFIHWMVQLIVKPFNIQRVLALRLDKLAQQYNGEKTSCMGTLNYIIFRDKVVFPKAWYCGGTLLKFENKLYLVPKQYDKYLKFLYGNYMELPPERERISHHSTEIYWLDK